MATSALLLRALFSAAKTTAEARPMIATTTRSSIKVKPVLKAFPIYTKHYIMGIENEHSKFYKQRESPAPIKEAAACLDTLVLSTHQNCPEVLSGTSAPQAVAL